MYCMLQFRTVTFQGRRYLIQGRSSFEYDNPALAPMFMKELPCT